MRRILIATACLLACSACTSADDHSDVVTEQRTLTNFSSVTAGGAMQVDIKVGSPQSVTIECNKDSMSDVNTVVNQDELTIDVEDDAKPTHMAVHIVTPSLNSLELAGATEAVVSGVNSKAFSLTTAGSTKVKVDGAADDLQMELSGSSDVQAADLKSKTCELTISGSGKADIYASQAVDATIAGSGSLKVHGNPAKLDQHITGSGSIEKI